MRYVELLPKVESVPESGEGLERLEAWLSTELDDSLSARMPLEQEWLQCLRSYESKPRLARRDTPIENAPNIEVPIGAIAADAIYAQATDLINNVSPPITVRPLGKASVQAAKDLQVYVNWMSEQELQMRGRSGGGPSDHAMLDDIQLGTGIFHIPFEEWRKKTKSQQVLWASPRCYAVPVEDFIVPPGPVVSFQTARYCGYRMYHTKESLHEVATELGWDDSLARPAAAFNLVRQMRERIGRSLSARHTRAYYAPWKLYCYFDIDGDGIDEDLQVGYDHESRKLLGVRWNPYDRRPFAAMQYQIRAHMFYGLGVMAMLDPFQREATELHNYRTLNLLLANARVWVGRNGVVPQSMRLWPNKIVTVPNPTDDLKAVAMADVYPSAFQAEALTLTLAEKRVGTNDLSNMRGGAGGAVGSRTPGITALSLLNQALRRFTPAFDGIRLAHAEVIRQALYRLQERMLAGGMVALDVQSNILRVMGQAAGQRLVTLLTDQHFDEAVAIELTASSATVNREADRQNAILLANIMTQYYERLIQLATVAANQQVPQPIRDVARKIAEAAGELADRTIRTFDQVRDPETLVVSLEDIFAELDRRTQTGFGGLGVALQTYFGQLTGGNIPAGNTPSAGSAIVGANGAG